jgi:DNA-binding transcriptional regulator YhcF (GntR family)
VILSVDPSAAEPPYEQLRRQLAVAIDAGRLRAGEPLPTVRRLAADLSLAPNTVARAYRELEQAGLVRTEGRRGTRVSDRGDARAQAEAAARDYAVTVRRLGVDAGEALKLARRALREAH